MKRPQLGDRVRFTHFWDKPTRQEVQFAAEGEEVELQRRELAEPMIGVVVGRTRVPTKALIYLGVDGDPYPDWHSSGKEFRSFYVVKRSFRERRYLVDATDIREVLSGDRAEAQTATGGMIPDRGDLPPGRRRVYDAIARLEAELGHAPSIREIAQAAGLASTSTVHMHLTHLLQAGLIRRATNRQGYVIERGRTA